MANKAFVAKNGLTVNTASVIMSQLSGTLTQASGGENLTLDENGQLGTQTNAQIKSNIGAGVVETITAGNGLTGGGTGATVAVALGTPTTLTVSTTDTVGATTHAHAITTSSDVTGGTAAILASDGTGKLQVATINATSIQIGGTAVSSDAGELNLVDGSSAGTVVNSKAVIYGSSGEVNATTLQIGGTSITATAAEINLIDGGATVAAGAAVADGDGLLLNDAGTMRMTTVQNLAAYLDDEITAMPNLTSVGTLGATSFSGAITPNASGTIDLGSASAEFNDLFLADSSAIKFGNDQEVTLTHDADKGLTLKHTSTSGAPTFTLAAGDTNIAADDVIGAIDFIAPDEASGTADQNLLAGSIRVVSEGDFSDTSNASKMSFMLGVSEAASEKMSLASNGTLTISGNLVVSGTTTTVSSTTIEVNDSLLFLAQNNTSSDAVDIGFFGTYDDGGTDKYAGLFRDANDGKFRLFKDNEAEPDTTVNVSGTGYAVATLVANLEGTLQTAAQGNVTSLGTLTGLQIANDGNIGSAGDSDAIAIAAGGAVTFSQNPVFPAGGVDIASLDIDGGTDIGEALVDADLFIVDNGAGGTNRKMAASRLKTYLGVAAGSTDIGNLDIDGGTDIGAALTTSDLIIVDDGADGTNRKAALSRVVTLMESEIDSLSSLTTTGALNSGSITSGFGTIDTGSSAISTTGVLTGGSIVITDESVIGTTDTDAIRIGAGGSVAFSNNTVLYGASNSTVAVASTQTFSGTISASQTDVVFTFKAKDGTSGTIVTGATNYQGGEIVLTLKKGTDVETKKIMIHHDGDPSLDGTDVFITEFATLGTELGETITTSMGDADGTSLSSNSDKHVHLKIQNPSGTDAMTYAGVAHLVEIPGDS